MADQSTSLEDRPDRQAGQRESNRTVDPAGGRIRLGFLFNHEALHQIHHSAPILAEVVRHHPDIDVSVLASTEDELRVIQDITGLGENSRCSFTLLEMSVRTRVRDALLGRVSPIRRYDVLKDNLKLFASFDALVVPELTSLLLKRKLGLKNIKLIYTHHGAGDRAVGYNPAHKDFDFILVPGAKVRDRMLDAGLISEGRYKVVGYPKFDAVRLSEAKPKRFFDNDRPTVLYNPHFDPYLSSWYKLGPSVLSYFAQSTRYNLIFAPHAMLFKRHIHTSLERRLLRIRPGMPASIRDCSHIHVDTGSMACFDMTYTQAADIYLGDVSSQIYEFLVRPRPCIFINAHDADWQDDPNYLHWRLGPVVTDIKGLDVELARATESHAQFRARQEQLVAETFDLTDTPSARRAADAVAEFLRIGRVSDEAVPGPASADVEAAVG